MIRFKGSVCIAPEQIISIEPGDNGYSQINTVSGVYFVAESPQEVARKVLKWRLAMKRYRAYVTAAALDENPQSNESWKLAANAKAELVRLAGLEEPNHDTR